MIWCNFALKSFLLILYNGFLKKNFAHYYVILEVTYFCYQIYSMDLSEKVFTALLSGHKIITNCNIEAPLLCFHNTTIPLGLVSCYFCHWFLFIYWVKPLYLWYYHHAHCSNELANKQCIVWHYVSLPTLHFEMLQIMAQRLL